jgi:transposase
MTKYHTTEYVRCDDSEATHVICNACDFVCESDEQETSLLFMEDERGYLHACPNCKTDADLSDIKKRNRRNLT